MLNIKAFPVNPLEENTYVVSEPGGDAFIIDCGALYTSEQEAIAQYITEQHLTPIGHLLTHAHFDHTFGAMFIHQTYGLQPRFHAADAQLYAETLQQQRHFLGRPVTASMPPSGTWLDEGTPLNLGAYRFQVLPTPGHTQGGICLYCAEEGVLFSGDSLFRQSIGRTDLPGGDYSALIEALTRLMELLPDNVTIYCGHGPTTTAAFERQYNPFLK